MSPLLDATSDALTNLTTTLRAILAQTKENNRALKDLCQFATDHTSRAYCSAGSSLAAPSVMATLIAARVVVLMLHGMGRG
ncbi:MAG: hypothetical protein L6R40_001616 [Gallowayella cf. fulva]|nr:MAG: hypothetical protein L6R40_001616 [Xanthomendoza cf. fulva]